MRVLTFYSKIIDFIVLLTSLNLLRHVLTESNKQTTSELFVPTTSKHPFVSNCQEVSSHKTVVACENYTQVSNMLR